METGRSRSHFAQRMRRPCWRFATRGQATLQTSIHAQAAPEWNWSTRPSDGTWEEHSNATTEQRVAHAPASSFRRFVRPDPIILRKAEFESRCPTLVTN